MGLTQSNLSQQWGRAETFHSGQGAYVEPIDRSPISINQTQPTSSDPNDSQQILCEFIDVPNYSEQLLPEPSQLQPSFSFRGSRSQKLELPPVSSQKLELPPETPILNIKTATQYLDEQIVKEFKKRGVQSNLDQVYMKEQRRAVVDQQRLQDLDERKQRDKVQEFLRVRNGTGRTPPKILVEHLTQKYLLVEVCRSDDTWIEKSSEEDHLEEQVLCYLDAIFKLYRGRTEQVIVTGEFINNCEGLKYLHESYPQFFQVGKTQHRNFKCIVQEIDRQFYLPCLKKGITLDASAMNSENQKGDYFSILDDFLHREHSRLRKLKTQVFKTEEVRLDLENMKLDDLIRFIGKDGNPYVQKHGPKPILQEVVKYQNESQFGNRNGNGLIFDLKKTFNENWEEIKKEQPEDDFY